MCGIVAVVRRPSDRTPPPSSAIVDLVERAQVALDAWDAERAAERLAAAAEPLEEANRLLQGVAGVRCLLSDGFAAGTLADQLASFGPGIEAIEAALDRGDVATGAELETVNAALVRLKDAVWAVHRDRLRTAAAVAALAGPDPTPSALDAFTSIEVALSAIDRLEVRGRDSAGIHVLVSDHGLDLDAPSVRSALETRSDPLFRANAVRTPSGCLSFVYKAAAEIGELGDNTRAIREQIVNDALLHRAVSEPGARAVVLGHTRWASVGMVSEANAHPLNSEEQGASSRGPYVVAALNGDVDNYADLKAANDLAIPDEVTTDAKVIPVLTSRRMAEGSDLAEAFRTTVASFDGSVAIAAASAADPSKVLCALRGSGQALYVGLSEDAYVVASEPYGLVEQCGRYLRMDGEALADPTDPGSRGQVVVLDASHAGDESRITRLGYDGTSLPVGTDDLTRPAITTRDIDRGEHPHFLLKEINESPRGFRKTLRGKLVASDAGLDVVLGEETMPASLVERLAGGEIRRIVVIGQGTAAVAGRALAVVASELLSDAAVGVEAMAATELSGFRMREDMSDALVIAVSQSGTTTDTNRTVEIAKAKGASIIAIVNRRNSDLCDRADGVLYTSDGRDVEMAVPSTKAFYAQVAAGFLLAVSIARSVGTALDAQDLLAALRDLPDAMDRVLHLRDGIADVARRHAPHRRYWAIVGNGPNRIAAEEVRIKLSELCYKSIACDVTEDKKHIDLSAEPLILVCAAGLEGSNAEDVAKEVAIYRAHKAAPIVICGPDAPFHAAIDVIRVPSVHPSVDFVLSAMAGHLFGYEAALAIDEQAKLLREARQTIEEVVSTPEGADAILEALSPRLEPVAHRFFEGLREGAFDGHLDASTAVRISSLLRYGTTAAPLELYQVEHGKVGTPNVVVDDLVDALTAGIDELTRPIDAIKHQAKTVTVGISRADETLLRVPLVREVIDAGVGRDRLSYRTLRALASLDAAVERVHGYTHYRIEGDVRDEATIHVTDKGGIARDIPSRTDRDPRLRGTKHRVASERDLLVTKGRSDNRTLVIVPEIKGTEVTGIALLHVAFHDRLPSHTMRAVLEGYRDRYAALRDIVTETEPTFRDDLLADMPVVDLLVDSIQALADRWRTNGG